LFVENQVPILREADILSPTAANTPCERIYLAVQLMYVDQENAEQHRQSYDVLVNDVLEAAPSTKRFVEEMHGHVSAGRHYHALKSAKGLLEYEQELLSRGTQSN
jgi:flagellar protein FlbT